MSDKAIVRCRLWLRRNAAVGAMVMALALWAHPAAGNMVQGDYLGTFGGNDSEAALLSDLGLLVEELAKVDEPATSNDGLTISNLVLDGDNEPISGDWAYVDPNALGRLVDILVVKAGNEYAAYHYTDANTANMRNVGIWDTGDVMDRGMSHISAYQIIPEPATLALLALGGLTLLWRKRAG
jgi:hypothetical protein